MLVDTPRVTEIVQDGRRIPQAGDSQVLIPSLILLTVDPAVPHMIQTSFAEPARESLITEAQRDANNLAAGGDTLCTLGPGLWRVTINLAIATSAIGSLKWSEITVTLAGFTQRIAALPAAGAIYQNTVVDRIFNFRSNAVLVMNYPLTAAGEFFQYRIGLSATKLL